jgi:signal transduction histidine kinase
MVVINEKLGKLSLDLDAKNIELNNQREELHSMQHNLKEMVEVKVDQIVKKSERLKEYAFLNAHDVRGPVARILGLINLIEKENVNLNTNHTIQEIKKGTQEIDNIVRRINQVIS